MRAFFVYFLFSAGLISAEAGGVLAQSGGILAQSAGVSARPGTFSAQAGAFEDYHVSLSVHLTQYDTSHFNRVMNRISSDNGTEDLSMAFGSSRWEIRKRITAVTGEAGAFDIEYVFRCAEGSSPASAVSVDLRVDRWSVKNYVLLPAAVYNGNRVKSIRQPYCPFLMDYNDMGPDKPQIISDVPRLNTGAGPSRIQQRTGDMSTPAIGFQSARHQQGCWLLTEQNSGWGDNGIDIEENADRSSAVITLTAPVVRESYQYFIADMQRPSTDRPANFRAGDSVRLKSRVYFFRAPVVQDLYNKFASIRNAVIPKGSAPAAIPFSAAYHILEEKFNRQNFEPKFGYYSVGLRENYFQDWQIGWVGGMMSTYALLMDGDSESRANVIRNFDWLFPAGISPSGYFWDSGEKGDRWFGIFQNYPQARDLHLVRKSGDALYYILRQLELFERLGIPVKKGWVEGTGRVANAFVKTWKTYGQLGQYVNNTTGELVIGGSTSGGIVPAGLILAGRYYHDTTYSRVAAELASWYYQQYVVKGTIYGGPGDALQNFDSESAYGLLESFSVLYEETGDRKWLAMAEDMAKQYITWVSSYDYVFPAGSTLGKLGKKTTGVVWANTQNKHGAPGICTHSGLAFLRLYRATGDSLYLDVLRQISRAIPQYLSTVENPIPGLQPGWISERVSTTDWLEGIGEIMKGSTWAETSLLLTTAELPGIYVDLERGKVFVLDQLEVLDWKHKKGGVELRIRNPTGYDARVGVLVESAKAAGRPFREVAGKGWNKVDVPAGKTVLVKLKL